MKTIYSVFLLTFLFSVSAFSQGLETFTNMPASNSSYLVRSWTGDNAIDWSANDARTDQVITTRAIGIRNSTLTSGSIGGGIANLSFNYKYIFTGSAASLSVRVNGNVVATIAVPSTQTTSIAATVSNINVSGNFVLEIQQTVAGARVALDDISWTGFAGGPDVTPPAISTLTPADNAGNVSINNNLQIVFSESVLKGTGDIVLKRVSDNSLVQTIPVADAGVSIAGSTATININTLANSTDYYVEIATGAFTDAALNQFAGISGATTWNFTTVTPPATGVVGTNYTFTNCASTFTSEGWLQYSVTGPSQVWGCSTTGRTDANAVQMNAFVSSNNNPLNEDWLISPAFDLTSVSLPVLNFYSRGDFNGNSLQLRISSNYVSGTDPNTATWTNLNGNFPANVAGTGTWTLSNNIDLSAFNTANVRVAWIYINPTTTASSRWTIDDISVTSNIPCPEPVAQPTNLTLNSTASSVSGTFTPVVAPTTIQNYLVVRSLSNTLTQLPVDGTSYTNGQLISGGNGTVITVSNNGTFTDNTVASATQYYYFVFSIEDQSCVGGPNYNTINPLTLSVITATPPACVTPAAPTTPFTLTPANTTVTGTFTESGASKYLVIRSTMMPPLGATPANGTVYTAGQTIGSGTVVNYTASNTFTATGLSVATTYYFYVFAANDVCLGEPFYSTVSIDGSSTTTNNSTGIPAGYYDAASGLTCAALKTALSNIITSGHTQNSYGGLDDVEMLVTDNRLNDAGTQTIVYDMYSDNPLGPEPYTFTFSQFNIGSGSDGEGNGWNKEHSFPNSWFSSTSSTNNFPGADLHHLFPTDMDVNSLRSNFPYGKVATATTTTANGSKLGSSAITFGTYTGPVFEPIDAFKGDFARATLYMVTRYQAEQPSWENLQPNGDVVMDGTTYPSIELDYLTLLVQWHNADPVSAKEIARNNNVYGFQNNRNPFIDHPEYVGQIWQCAGVLPVNLTEFTAVQQTTTVQLKWSASNETSFKMYEVQRSVDAASYTSIGTVQGQNLANYNFVDDKLPNAGTVYYRLKMIDIDGRFTYSKVVPVRLNKFTSNATVYPNPTAGLLNIRFTTAIVSNTQLLLTDVTGRLVMIAPLNKGALNVDIDLKRLPAGRYFIKINDDQNVIHQSVVVAK